jgi:hypothetical protein
MAGVHRTAGQPNTNARVQSHRKKIGTHHMLRRILCDSVDVLIELWGRTHGLFYKGFRKAVQIFGIVTGSEKYLFNPGNVSFNPYSARVLQSTHTRLHILSPVS